MSYTDRELLRVSLSSRVTGTVIVRGTTVISWSSVTFGSLTIETARFRVTVWSTVMTGPKIRYRIPDPTPSTDVSRRSSTAGTTSSVPIFAPALQTNLSSGCVSLFSLTVFVDSRCSTESRVIVFSIATASPFPYVRSVSARVSALVAFATAAPPATATTVPHRQAEIYGGSYLRMAGSAGICSWMSQRGS